MVSRARYSLRFQFLAGCRVEGTEIADYAMPIRRSDVDQPTGAQDPGQFAQTASRVADVLDHVVVEHDVETVVGEREVENAAGEQLEIRDVSAQPRLPFLVYVDPDQRSAKFPADEQRFVTLTAACDEHPWPGCDAADRPDGSAEMLCACVGLARHGLGHGCARLDEIGRMFQPVDRDVVCMSRT